MGAQYSAPTLKTALKMAGQRLAMHRNKKNNQVSVDSKQVALLLQQNKDESARIRCEAILHEKNLASAMETLQLMTELLAARVALITASKECPMDLQEGIASIIYCSTRIEVPELKQISEQFAAKYGREWAESHVNNASGKVHTRIQEKLSIRAPSFEVLLSMMREIAAQYEVAWEPDMQALEAGIVDHTNPEKLGSIARIQPSTSGAPSPTNAAANNTAPAAAAPAPAAAAASAPSPTTIVGGQYPMAGAGTAAAAAAPGIIEGGISPYPGTLNLLLHRGRDLVNVASQSEPHDLYVTVTNLTTKVSWKSPTDPAGGSNPLWYQNPRLPENAPPSHFPLSIMDGTQQIQLDVCQANTGTFKVGADKSLGSTVVYAETFRANSTTGGPQWYPVFAQSMQTGYLLITAQFLPLNATILSQEELHRQTRWQQQERQQVQQQQQQHMSSPHPHAHMPAPIDAAGEHDPGAPAGSGDGGSGGGGGRSGGLVGLAGRMGEKFSQGYQGPLSPPHDHTYSLSDIVAGRNKPQQQPQQSQQPQQQQRRRRDSQPGSEVMPEVVEEEEEEEKGGPQIRGVGPEYYLDRDVYDEDVYTEFPPVPEHRAGAARASAAAASSSAASAAASSSSSAAPARNSSAGARPPGGAALRSAPPPQAAATTVVQQKPLSADEEMEARFRRLNGL